MKTEIKLRDAIGKTLESFSLCGLLSSQAVLVFTDGTFATLGIDCGYEPGDQEIIEESLKLFDFGDGRLVDAGIVTREEIDAMRKEMDIKNNERIQKAKELRDLQEFERLKKKYGV